ncbi:multiple sugar transport system permease protein [Candidatus Planktophila dulcis]|jgi:multiple sugar transport system permease protein|uniref:carbohydrate ABC transporter permease n=1 Tax=Candidatus Planktophila dulcis TaxID=1884914 RepID=UPI000BAC5EC4|nr:carbohydrate ABC transporter permease [Candidatus Planktophila dulcis]ASY21050.1 multiple sugar transport system permease protein [Candidatus Planktophila dulcis]
MLKALGKGTKFTVLGLWFIFTIFPLYWMALTSIRPVREVTQKIYYPKSNSTLDSYRTLFSQYAFGTYLRNSLLVALAAAAFVIFVGLLGAYALARYKFKGKSQIMLVFLVTQMIPALIALAPLYLLLSKVGLLNSLIGLTLCYVGGMVPFATIMLRGFLQRIPPELDEAAMIDGCNRFTALFRVVFPVALPGIAATFIFAFVQCWNELFLAMILIDSDGNKTFPVAMRSFIGAYYIEWGGLAASVMIGIIPTVLIFALMSKFMISGLTAGIVKG